MARATDALVAADIDANEWLEALAVLDDLVDRPAYRRVSDRIGLALRGFLVDREPGGELWRMALDVWRATDDFHTQYLCDFAGAALLRDPHDEEALDDFLEGTFLGGDPYIHRGTDLEHVASRLAEGPRRTALLGLHAIIAGCAGMSFAAEAMARARRDPDLDLAALRARCERFTNLLDDQHG